MALGLVSSRIEAAPYDSSYSAPAAPQPPAASSYQAPQQIVLDTTTAASYAAMPAAPVKSVAYEAPAAAVAFSAATVAYGAVPEATQATSFVTEIVSNYKPALDFVPEVLTTSSAAPGYGQASKEQAAAFAPVPVETSTAVAYGDSSVPLKLTTAPAIIGYQAPPLEIVAQAVVVASTSTAGYGIPAAAPASVAYQAPALEVVETTAQPAYAAPQAAPVQREESSPSSYSAPQQQQQVVPIVPEVHSAYGAAPAAPVPEPVVPAAARY